MSLKETSVRIVATLMDPISPATLADAGDKLRSIQQKHQAQDRGQKVCLLQEGRFSLCCLSFLLGVYTAGPELLETVNTAVYWDVLYNPAVSGILCLLGAMTADAGCIASRRNMAAPSFR